MNDPAPSAAFIDEYFERAGKLSYCEARIKRVVEYLEYNPNPDREYVVDMLRGALQEIARDQ